MESLTSPSPSLLRQRIGQGIASAKSSASGYSPTLTPALGRVSLKGKLSSLISPFAKRWGPVYLTQFKEDQGRSFVEAKRDLGAPGEGMELFFEDFEKSVPNCKVEEVREFCNDARLDILKSGSQISGT